MRYLLLVCSLLLGFVAQAQDNRSVTYTLPNVTANNNSEVCLPVTVVDFTGSVGFGFALQWTPPSDGGALTFSRVANLNGDIPNFTLANFDLTTYVASGLITVQWQNYENEEDCDQVPRISLDDGDTLFEVCYNVSGPVAGFEPVRFFNKPDDDPFDGVDDSVPISFNRGSTCRLPSSAFPFSEDGSVSIEVSPLILDVIDDDGIYLPGDIYCIDIEATSGFNSIKGYQFGMTFDTTVLRSVSATANTDLRQNTDGGYNLFGGTSFYAVWAPFPDDSESLPDGTPLVTVCFEVVGECGDRTDLTISEIPTSGGSTRPVDANGDGPGLSSIPVIGNSTRLIVDNCNPNGFDVVVNCPSDPVNFGDTEVCVQIQAGDDFVDMTDIDYIINWDPSILEYTSIRNRDARLFIDLNTDFEYDRVNDGILAFDWSYVNNNGFSLNRGDVIYEVCFNAIGFGGTSGITIGNFRNDIESATSGFFSGVNPTNCAITVQRPDGVAVNFPATTGFSSTQENCLDITLDGFENVTDFTLFVSYSSSLFTFSDFSSPIAGVTFVDLAPGLLQINYSGAALTLADGTILGSFCAFAESDAAPGDCAEIDLASFVPSTVVTTESEGNSVPIESFGGEACVLFPRGFGLIIGEASSVIDSTVCVPVSVTRFTDITSVNVDFSFDPNLLAYSEVRLTGPWTGLTTGDFDAGNAPLGLLNLTWSTGDPGGLNIADMDTVQVFELCFTTGLEDGCADLAANDGATPATVTAGGDGSIIYQDGEVCIEDRIILLNIEAIPATCEDNDDGQILFETANRPNNEDLFIRVDNPVRFGNTGQVGGLLPGMQNYVIYNSTGSVSLSGSIMVGVDPANAAVADAGNNAELSCVNQTAIINGRNNVGETYELFLVLADGGSRSVDMGTVAGDGNVVASVTEAGTYFLEVTSAAGCTDRDTVMVTGAGLPIAMTTGDTAINCINTEILISGEGSSEGNNVRYLWESVTPQGDVVDTVGMDRDYLATTPGRYRLTVEFFDLGCSSSETVLVRNNQQLPNSLLPTSVALNCDGSPVELNIGPAEDDVTYSWTRLGDAMELSNTTMFSTTELNTFVATMTNELTGCVNQDTVEIVESAGVPAIEVPAEVALNCDPDTTVIAPTYTNVDDETDYLWSTDDGQLVITDVTLPNPRVTRAGTYRVVVSNGACQDSMDVVVSAGILPTVEAGDAAQLECGVDLSLTGSASTTTGASLSFQWLLNGQEVPMGAAQSIVISQPGTYFLEVTDDNSGCVGIDSVVIDAPVGFPEYTLQDTLGGLGCSPSTLDIRVSDPVDTYTYRWLDPDDNEISTNIVATADRPGFYTVEITNPATSCVSVDSVFVNDDATDLPFVAFRQNTVEITCESGRAVLDASPSTDGPNFQYTWEAVVDGETPATQNDDTLRVNTAGTYRLTILNTTTNCSASRELVVTDTRDFPNVEPIEGTTLDCETRETMIGINILDQPNDYTIQWSGPAGVDDLPNDVENITITQGGTYNAVVINPITSCVTTIPIRVEDLLDSIAMITFMPVDSFDCSVTTVTIDASDTDANGATGTNIAWSSLDGNTITPETGSLIVSVNGPGDYELAITDETGCTVRDTVSVVAANNTPFAQAGEPIEVDCDEMPQLDGSGSTPPDGNIYVYEWSASDGGMIVTGGDGLMPFVSGPGTYQLVVTNTQNLCSDTSTTTVTLREQSAAMLPADFSSCETPVTVTGNQPDGTTGVWTAFNDEGSAFTVEGNVATITEIADGLALVWTLSAGGCPDYSADTIRVTPEESPLANPDVLTVGGTQNVGQINVLTNDQRTGPVTVTFLDEPEFGEIIVNLNGDVTFEAPIGFTGTTVIRYEVCSNACPNLCAESTLTLNSSADGEDPQVFNAITPNGDGLNETFIFDILLQRPDDFPDNELIIFNRWGDIIYEAAPYNNDWDGTNADGSLVPEGTYYYILRLDIGEGKIERGDITVIR
ncbi:gliding motility-associated C-terminal domain-containing protein [Lewinella sp. W8]|uniref:gliding motility-associated C-terminal domain-containing protein n=1 Tax=Lewinella sp. W8 TaxID=2528208 RepID=UPI001562F45A|nr:gliding motility-associated C-terminal domain-containing protein [Lewinella sp. W8]